MLFVPPAAVSPIWHSSPDDEGFYCDNLELPDAGKRFAADHKRNYRRLQLEKYALADSYEAAGRDDVANQLRNCCTCLIVHRYARGAVVRGINECKHPACPSGQIERAHRNFASIGTAVERFLEKNAGLQGVMVTLTEQSCASNELRYRVGEILRAFGRLMTFAKVKRAVEAYVRSVEFTRNAITGLWHCHIHVLILVSRAEYFRKGSRLYISQADWAALWRKALRAPYTPVVDVRALKGVLSPLTPTGLKSLREIIKYPLKPGSLVYWQNGRPHAVGTTVPELYRTRDDNTLRPMLNVPVMAFADAVKGRRLVATSVNLQGDTDLDFTDDPQAEAKAFDLGEFICTEVYRWHTRGRDGDFYLVSRSFDEPKPGGGFAMGP